MIELLKQIIFLTFNVFMVQRHKYLETRGRFVFDGAAPKQTRGLGGDGIFGLLIFEFE